MDQSNDPIQQSPSSMGPIDERRRDAIRKLGQFAAYAAPFTLLAVNSKASQGGSGSGGRTGTPSTHKRR